MFLFGFAAVKLYRGDGKSTLLRDRNEQYFHTIRDNTQQDTIQNNVFESLLLSWQLFKHSLFAIYTRYPNEIYLFFMPRTNNYQTTFNRTSIDAQKLVDERHGPYRIQNAFHIEMRTKTNFRPLPAISSYAGQDMGKAGSYTAVKAYQTSFAQRRDEILTAIAKDGI